MTVITDYVAMSPNRNFDSKFYIYGIPIAFQLHSDIQSGLVTILFFWTCVARQFWELVFVFLEEGVVSTDMTYGRNKKR